MKRLKKIIQRKASDSKLNSIKYPSMAFTALYLSLVNFNGRVYASDSIIQKVNSIYTLVVGIVGAAGAIVLAWGIFEFATAYQSHDSTTQTQALKKVVSGILMCAASTLVNLLK